MSHFWNWLITSSADPAQTGLAVRGFLVGLVPMLDFISPIVCQVVRVCFDLALVSPVIDGVVNLVVAVLSVVSAVMIVWGLGRKVSFGRWSAAE